MRILFLSNFYPPARPGGYTQWCHEVAESLATRGHTIGVLTSDYEQEQAPDNERDIYRVLHLESDLFYYRPLEFFLKWKRHEQENLAALAQVVEHFKPDLVFVWGMWALSKRLPALAESLLPSRVVYYLSDYWPSDAGMHAAYWRRPSRRWLGRLPKRILGALAFSMLNGRGKPVLQFDHVICVSTAVREMLVEAGVPIQHARVIHGGTDVSRFLAANSANGHAQADQAPHGLRLLYAGQLVPHKGVHTAIDAMAMVVHDREMKQVSLTVVGPGHPAYEASLHERVKKNGLQDHVTFRDAVTREEMPALLRQFDALVFPSIYEEPLARMTQEAMLAGLVVLGTTTGGTKEILKDGENGLTFPAEDAEGLARQIKRVASSPELLRRLAEAGQQTVLERFTLDRMVDEIEGYLQDVAGFSSRGSVPLRQVPESRKKTSEESGGF